MRTLFGLYNSSIKTRLLIAVSLLALATLTIGLASLYWLTRSNQILSDLHDTTLEQVNRSHELTRQSSVFATSVPFFLNLRSPYLIKSEGAKLLSMIDSATSSWQSEAETSLADNQSADIITTLGQLRSSMVDLMSVVEALAEQEDKTRRYTAELSAVSERIQAKQQEGIAATNNDDFDNQAEVIASLLFAASHANSFLSLGEYRRSYLDKTNPHKKTGSGYREELATIHTLAVGTNGLFNTRYKVLQHNIATRRALSSISTNVNTLSELLLGLIQRSENDIAHRKKATSDSLKSAIILVAVFGLGAILLAILSALYISGYVVRNLNTVTNAMTMLAGGNLEFELPFKDQRNDEIGKLRSAFNVFQENAINLSRLNKQLEQKSAQFESTFNNINDGIAITGANGNVLAKNPRLNQLLSLFGKESEISTGCNLENKVHKIAQLAGEPALPFAGSTYTDLSNNLGQNIEVRTSILPDGGQVWLFSDTTERRRVEEKLRHFQRLESLGQLTGEVAHDVNNVLSAIQTTIPRVLSSREDHILHKAAVDRIDDAVELGSSLTQRLLAFAKKQQLDPQTIELNELLSGVADLISLSMGDRVKLIIRESKERIFVTIDPLQLESALLNLSLNSARAIDGEGTLSITVSQHSDDMAELKVVDTGCGMPEEVSRRAVEPFFSTQRGSSGSGLGLSIVYGFIKQSGGDLQIASTPGKGTTVQLLIPISHSTASADIPKRSVPDKVPVIVVEDDPQTLQHAVSLLRQMGLDTVEASSADSAISYIGDDHTNFSVLFTDLCLGVGKTGWDLARAALLKNSDAQVIVTSGSFNESDVPPADLSNTVSLLNKPYTIDDLARLLNR